MNIAWMLSENPEIYFNGNSHLYKTKELVFGDKNLFASDKSQRTKEKIWSLQLLFLASYIYFTFSGGCCFEALRDLYFNIKTTKPLLFLCCAIIWLLADLKFFLLKLFPFGGQLKVQFKHHIDKAEHRTTLKSQPLWVPVEKHYMVPGFQDIMPQTWLCVNAAVSTGKKLKDLFKNVSTSGSPLSATSMHNRSKELG